jgi:hypothetical protein
MSKKYQYRDDTKRTHMVTVRFSDDEFEQLNFLCYHMNKTKSQYIRESVLMAWAKSPTFQVCMSTNDAKQIAAQMGKIGSNLNQIARKLNWGDAVDNQIRENINDCISDLNDRLQSLRAMEEYHGNLEALERSQQLLPERSNLSVV